MNVESSSREVPGPTFEVLRLRRRLAWGMTLAALLALLALGRYALQPAPREQREITAARGGPEGAAPDAVPEVHGMTARPRTLNPAPLALRVGEEVHTQADQRRRVAMPDGSLLYLNENTSARVEAARRLALNAGEVFVEVSRREDAQDPFVVSVAGRTVAALGTKFAVRTDHDGPRVFVTQGRVQVEGTRDLLHAGEQLVLATGHVSAAPRATHVLDWTRDLMIAAESPLVPASKHQGGALLAVDPNGQLAQLSLRKYHVDVHIEDGFARTTIDQTYFNHETWRLEGTFHFPLPPDASLSHLAMYVDGVLMQGGMCERDHARQVFETILRTQRDPALLEWVDGTTFKMRVFPLEARQEKRILLSYTQRLDTLYGQTRYRFPAGHNLEVVNEWSFQARIKRGGDLRWRCDSHKLLSTQHGGDLLLSTQQRRTRLDRDLVLTLHDAPAPGSMRFSSALHEGHRYLMVRCRPALKAPVVRQRRDWVFLFESGGNRDPLLARVQIDIIRTLLNHAELGDTFAVLTSGPRPQTFTGGSIPVTPENTQQAVQWLERTHLIGALDLGKALTAAEPFLKAAKNPHLVHVGAGVAALGERREEVLARSIAERVRYVGVGVGKRWSRNFMKQAAERTGGFFTQINPDESVAWRTFDLLATLNTPRLLNVQVQSAAEKGSFLGWTTLLADGEEFCAITRLAPDANRLPDTVTITGQLEGKPFRQQAAVRNVAEEADYLPRTWARLEIDRLLAAGAQANKERLIELSKAMYVMTPFTSLLVLENEQMYAQYNVDRGRKDHWALYPAPEKIPVVYEPLPGMPPVTPVGPIPQAKPSQHEVLSSILVRVPPRILRQSQTQDPLAGRIALTAAELYPRAFAVPEVPEVADSAPAPTQTDTPRLGGGVGGADIAGAGGLGGPEGPLPGGQMGQFRPVAGLGGGGGFGGFGGALGIAGGGVGGFAGAGGGLVNLGVGGGFGGFGGIGGVGGFAGFGGFGLRGFPGGSGIPGAPEPVDGGAPWNFAFRPRLLQELQNAQALAAASLGDSQGTAAARERARALHALQSWKALRSTSRAELVTLPEDDELSVVVGLKSADNSLTRHWAQKPHDDHDPLDEQGLFLAFGERYKDLHYQRPGFSEDVRVFCDLASYAPGLNTTTADIRAVLDIEARSASGSVAGQLDTGAKALLDKARARSWQSLRVASSETRSFQIVFDGSGRYVYERHLPFGLREQVVCDGTTLWHLYPEIGLGARRTVSRFHASELTRFVPWALPSAADLARGADVRTLDERTVTVLPHAVGQSTALHLIFAADGCLAERQIRTNPDGKLLCRETYAPDGTVRVLDAGGGLLAEQRLAVSPAEAPSLKPDLGKLVILPMPLRTQEHHQRAGRFRSGEQQQELRGEAALACLATEAFSPGGQPAHVFADCFASQGDRRLGLYVLLLAGGHHVYPRNTDSQNILLRKCIEIQTHHPDVPLARYLAHQAESLCGIIYDPIGKLEGPRDGLLEQLAAFHDQWWKLRRRPGLTATVESALEYARGAHEPAFRWAALDLLQNFHEKDQVLSRLAEAYRDFKGPKELDYARAYEYARQLARMGNLPAAHQRFTALYATTLKSGQLPPIDQDFFEGDPKSGRSECRFWAQQTAGQLLKENRWWDVVGLAWQCVYLGERALANEVMATLAASNPGEPHLPLALAVVEFQVQTGSGVQAEALLEKLLKNQRLAEHPILWRLAGQLALQGDRHARGIRYLEKALDLEFRNLPPVIDLAQVRMDYGQLLAHYQQLAEAARMLEAEPPRELVARVIRVADRWRVLDPDPTGACQAAAHVLQSLGLKELAWDYLTTPLSLYPSEPEAWLGLAQYLQAYGQFDLADRLYTIACEAEPTNADILFERASFLYQLGRFAEARPLYLKLATGEWPPEQQHLKENARQILNWR